MKGYENLLLSAWKKKQCFIFPAEVQTADGTRRLAFFAKSLDSRVPADYATPLGFMENVETYEWDKVSVVNADGTLEPGKDNEFYDAHEAEKIEQDYATEERGESKDSNPSGSTDPK